ncbi:MAG: NAD(P)-dependent oxidoreductase [Rothia sp. (in: high G+C Gram-positive bacteria)]|nr:NAD(P)-dependent oxidoreductase [Rothia sp. (in: high G+C Gram-positive bacteria)]
MGPASPTVLVTGATGFLGKYVVQELLDHGYRVLAAGRNRQRLASLQGPGVTTFAGSLTELSRQQVSFDGVVHCAALSTTWGSREEFYLHNVLGLQQVVDFAKRSGAQRLVHISSPSIYAQRGDRLNIREDEYDPANTLTNYIWSKLRSEELLAAVDSQELETVVLRPRGLMGAEDPSIVPRFLAINARFGVPLVNEGAHLIDLTCVQNVALACRLAMESPQAVGGTYNITNGEPRPFKELVDFMFDRLGQPVRYRRVSEAVLYGGAAALEGLYRTFNWVAEPPLMRYSVCTVAYAQTLDISRAREDLGYCPQVPLDQGIESSAAAHRGVGPSF